MSPSEKDLDMMEMNGQCVMRIAKTPLSLRSQLFNLAHAGTMTALLNPRPSWPMRVGIIRLTEISDLQTSFGGPNKTISFPTIPPQI